MRGKWFEIWFRRSCYLHPITAREWGRLMIGNVEECADRIVIHHQLQIFRKHFMSPHLSCLLPLYLPDEFAFYGCAEFADESYWRAVWTRISKPYISLYVGCFHFGLHEIYVYTSMLTYAGVRDARKFWRMAKRDTHLDIWSFLQAKPRPRFRPPEIVARTRKSAKSHNQRLIIFDGWLNQTLRPWPICYHHFIQRM